MGNHELSIFTKKDESAETIQKWSTLQANGSGSGEPIIYDSDDIVQTVWKHAEVYKKSGK